MKILFIGGTGRLSKDVADLAITMGNEVYLLTRGTQYRSIFVNEKYHMIYGDIRNAENCRSKLCGVHYDVIIDFLSFKVEDIENKLRILDGLYTQYIFISTASVYEKIPGVLIKEDDAVIQTNGWEYGIDKYKCEECLQRHFDRSKDTFYTVIRPAVTYGNTRIPYPIIPRDGTKDWSLVDRILMNKTIPVFDNGNTLCTLTHAKDFAVGVMGLLMNLQAKNQCYHITSDERVTWGMVLDILGEILNKDINKVNVTREKICSIMPEFIGVMWDKGKSMVYDNSKIKKVVQAYECKISLKEGLKGVVDFYNTHENYKLVDDNWNREVDVLCSNRS